MAVHTLTNMQCNTHTHTQKLTHHTHSRVTDVGQGGPGLVAGGKEGDAARLVDLRPQHGSVCVHLGGGGPHRAQGVVDVQQGESWAEGMEPERSTDQI